MASQFRPAPFIRKEFTRIFPNINTAAWHIKSPFDDAYKCIPWAACRTDIQWWPPGEGNVYWPPEAIKDDSIEAFVSAFATIGYKPCGTNADFEFGYQKVAIYASSERRVLHMARQHFLGRGWLSKCGVLEDILHSNLQCLEGDPSPWMVALGKTYGKVEVILRRSWWSAMLNLCLFRCAWHAFRFCLYRVGHPSWR